MFSRLALSSARLAPALRAEFKANNVLIISTRSSSITKHIENWDKANKLFYGPERDLKNFPIEKQLETSPPVRMGFIPESFFQAFYEKTGVTGPYLFGVGVVTTLLSKEIWIVDHGMMEFVSFWIAIAYIMKKFGPKMRTWSIKEQQEFMDRRWHTPLQSVKGETVTNIEALEKQIWREEGQKHLFEAKKENVDLQLEEEYRRRLAHVHQAVKKRLDYQFEVENTKRRFEQSHMVNWIVNSVVKGITPQQERDSISKCIGDLKMLSQKAQMA